MSGVKEGVFHSEEYRIPSLAQAHLRVVPSEWFQPPRWLADNGHSSVNFLDDYGGVYVPKSAGHQRPGRMFHFTLEAIQNQHCSREFLGLLCCSILGWVHCRKNSAFYFQHGESTLSVYSERPALYSLHRERLPPDCFIRQLKVGRRSLE